MDESKVLELLIELVDGMSFVKAKLSSIEEQKLASRISDLEAQNREHDKIIKTLENRSDSMEKYVREGLSDSKKQQTGVFISLGLALFSGVLSVLFQFLF